MVHALKEAWRVLRKNGILIDLRPLHDNITLEIMQDEEAILVTRYARESLLVNDEVADETIARVIGENMFQHQASAAFEYVKIYDTWEELSEFNAARNPPIEYADEIVEKIKLADTRPDIALRVGNPMQLKTYRRIDSKR